MKPISLTAYFSVKGSDRGDSPVAKGAVVLVLERVDAVEVEVALAVDRRARFVTYAVELVCRTLGFGGGLVVGERPDILEGDLAAVVQPLGCTAPAQGMGFHLVEVVNTESEEAVQPPQLRRCTSLKWLRASQLP